MNLTQIEYLIGAVIRYEKDELTKEAFIVIIKNFIISELEGESLGIPYSKRIINKQMKRLEGDD